jgi:hypothetical protein
MGAMAAAVKAMRRQGRVGNTAAVEVRSLRIFVFLCTFTLLQYVTYVFIIFRIEHKICTINICLNVFMFLGMLHCPQKLWYVNTKNYLAIKKHGN